MSMRSPRFTLFKFIIFILCINSVTSNASNIGKTALTKKIVGYAPYIQSINAFKMDDSQESDKPYLRVDDVLFVPTRLCEMIDNNLPNEMFTTFNFKDADLDECDFNAESLKWYILEAKNQDWSTITDWEQLETLEITADRFPDALISLPPSSLTRTDALKVPKDAVGKRIGFSFLPQTKTGIPSFGSRIYVWDLDYFFGQYPQNQTGNVFEDKGHKLEKTPHTSGGGIVFDNTQPSIHNLTLSGNYQLNERLTANYNFSANTELAHSVQNRFFWGEIGTTFEQASNHPEMGSLSHISPPLTEANIGGIYEVSALPQILLANEVIVSGAIVTQNALDDGNDLIGFNPFEPPEVTTLNIVGIYALGEKLTAEYTLNVNTQYGYQDISEFWWGIAGSTVQQAQVGENGSRSRLSEELTEEQIAKVYEVSIRPQIVIDEKFVVSGAIRTKRSDEENPELFYPPEISDLVIINHQTNTPLNGAGFMPGDKISGTYRYQSRSNHADRSHFEWRNQNDSLISSGNTDQGKVKEIEILNNYSGQTIELRVIAEDEREISGNILRKSTAQIYILPIVNNLQLIYNDYEQAPSMLKVGDTLSGKYDFVRGTNSIDASRYEWRRASNKIVINGGSISYSGSIPNFKISELLAGDTVSLFLQARDGQSYNGNSLEQKSVSVSTLPSIENLQFFYHSTNSTQAPPTGVMIGEQVSATYRFIGYNGANDRSTYEWQFADGRQIKAGSNENQKVPALTITRELTGSVLSLSVLAVDDKDMKAIKPEIIQLNTIELKYPAIADLTLLYGGSPDRPNYIEYQSLLSGRYTFQPGNDDKDTSIYEWITGEGEILLSQTVQKSGEIPGFNIPQKGLGKILTLKVTPKDGFNIEGQAETRDTIRVASAPKLQFMGFSYNTLNNSVLPQYGIEPGVSLTGRYAFSIENGPVEDASYYYWTYQNDPTILQSGATLRVSQSNAIGSTPFYTVQLSDVGKALQLHLMPRTRNGASSIDVIVGTQVVGRPPEILNLTLGNEQLNLFSKIYARYQFVGGNGEDRSRYSWRHSGTNNILKSGAVSYLGQDIFYQPDEKDVGKFIDFEIIPYDSNNRFGSKESIRSEMNITSNSGNPYIKNIQLKTLSGNPPLSGETVYAAYEWYFNLYAENSTAYEKTTFDWFVDGTRKDYGFVSRGTSNIVFRDTRQNTTRGTYKITQNDIGKTLKIVMYAIADWRPRPSYDIQTLYGNKTEGQLMLGAIPTVAPSIRNLTISYSESGSTIPPSAGISTNGMLYANYTFVRGSDGSSDNSNYEWRHGFTNQIRDSGSIINSGGSIKPYQLSKDDVGQIILLTVTPKSQAGNFGMVQRAQTPSVIIER